MFEFFSEDKLGRKISRLISKAEREGYDDDPVFVDMIEKLYQKRAEMYASRGYSTPIPSSDLGQ